MKHIVFVALAATIGVAGCSGPIVESYSFSDGALSRPNAHVRPLIYGLPVAYYVATVKRDEKVCAFTVALSTPTYVRDKDPRYNFVMQYDHDWYTSDFISFQPDSNGLLTAVNTTSENQVVAILTQSLALAAQLRPSTAAAEMHGATESGGAACEKIDVAYALNPNDDIQRQKFESLLHGLKVRVEPLDSWADAPAGVRTEPSERDADGVYFRLNRPYRLTVSGNGSSADVIFTAPDPNAIYRIRLDKRVFTKFDVKLGFEHGVLTKFESNDPSEALAALQAPANLIKAILGLSAL